MKESQIINFLKLSDYDIRKTQSARWIDQKCTPDVLSVVADCILEFTQCSIEKSFSIRDIWDSPYTNENVKMIFSKPDLNSNFSKHEYDKFFSQPIKLLTYSGILFENKYNGNKNTYTIQNIELLEYLMQRETNALKFLILYIQKVLTDSGIYPLFDNFLQKQDTESFKQLKDGFTHFTINNTAINNATECFRIFTKIINPLTFYYGKKGTRKGFLSNTIITKDELNYNRINWRDIGKNKNTTRQEHELISYSIVANSNYFISKAKKVVKQYNDNFNHSFSEVKGNEIVQATQIHHIFPVQDFPLIADYIENLIALTPNQHFIYAHPNNQTRLIDKDFQYICLLAKTNTIFNDTQGVYDLEHYIFVLNMGLKTTIFSQVNNKWELLRAIDAFYFDFNKSKDPSWQYLLDKNDLRAFKLKF
ncbi:restriction endonuclease [Helicobacter pylori]|uniref:restriction endonuclease n=1 Tax=Helicobacter pylori TaxID=210 RepID=UPI000EB4124F|nr:restriction endonuclease [Helicobacter pylori]